MPVLGTQLFGATLTKVEPTLDSIAEHYAKGVTISLPKSLLELPVVAFVLPLNN
ncbi:Unannotated [Lentimonas sp. CC4]|nr:Unannotated [Lentimonas sp. CC4]CAA6683772.1 Unannotated [Lentimonas sp. CC6]CAA7077833.1 Unannotated [Lentimonas sp. CC4]CAA7169763.1 Unannotated [Lentimonas sp. CC21]CAA7179881.1 Unannotated [Lentimonas sp. CC8]